MRLTSIIFERNSLASNVTRNLIGDRVINLAEDLASSEGEGGIVSRIFNFGKKLVGFGVSAIFSFAGWSLTAIWDFAVDAYYEIIYFDWNQTDAEIEAQLRQNDVLLSGSLGRLAGTGAVWLTGVAVSSALTFKFPVLAGRVALELAEEGGQEIRSALTSFLLTARNVAVQNMLLGGLVNARRLKAFRQQPSTGERKPWTIAEAIDERIDSISNENLRAFVRGFAESAEDAIIEMGYVVAYTIDDFYESQRTVQEDLLGQDRDLIITPDTRVEGEEFILRSPQDLIISDTQQLLNQHQLIYNRDVGQITGMPEDDFVSARPQRRKLRIVFKSVAKPPWKNADGSRAKETKLCIPDVKVALSWETLKNGIPKYTFGRFRVTAYLDNGRCMVVYGASFAEAKQQILTLMLLSTANITNWTQGEEVPSVQWRRKEPTLVYPAYCKLIYGDVLPSGELRSNRKESQRVVLWTDTEPDDLPSTF